MVAKDSTAGEPPADAADGRVPAGNYRLVSWDVDTTGRKLTDEICQIVAYTPKSQFAQYVMPYSDLDFQAQKRHNLCVITTYLYRMLSDLKTCKIIKTKSEVSALTDFLVWLEECRGDATDGVLLVCHEFRKMAPGLLLESLRRYGLLERFGAVVKGFANSYQLAQDKCGDTVKSYSLRMLSRVLLDKDEFMGNAANRARLCYMVVQHLGQSERQDLEGSGDVGQADERHAAGIVHAYAATIQAEERDLAEMKLQQERNNTLRPVFREFMLSNVHRQHAVRLRLLLVSNQLDCERLREAWDKAGRPGLEALLQAQLPAAAADQRAELLDIFDCYFDPAKEVVKPRDKARPAKPKKHEKKKSSASMSEKSGSEDTPPPAPQQQQAEPAAPAAPAAPAVPAAPTAPATAN